MINLSWIKTNLNSNLICDIKHHLLAESDSSFPFELYRLVSLRRNAVASSSSKSKKPSQSSGLKEGQPLPANGTCKHYKKSFRWLRYYNAIVFSE